MKKCADPVLCYTQGGATLYRHYSLASPIVRLSARQVFDCGKCIYCRKKRSAEIAVRCVLHASLSPHNCFLTLTYDEKKSSYHNRFNYADIQKFKKDFRRYCSYHFRKKIQIFNVHEYGRNGKKHWHLVVFNHQFSDRELFTIKNGNHLYTSERLQKLWPHGFSTIGNVTEASSMYQAQYTQKDVKNGNTLNDKKAHSKHSGIGRDYFYLHWQQILNLGYVPFAGRKVPVPRYFQKLAKKHYCHFYEPSAFHDTRERKALFRPFNPKNPGFRGNPSRDIADAYVGFEKQRKEGLLSLSEDWITFVELNAFSREKPDFLKSAENYTYDLLNKIPGGNF